MDMYIRPHIRFVWSIWPLVVSGTCLLNFLIFLYGALYHIYHFYHPLHWIWGRLVRVSVCLFFCVLYSVQVGGRAGGQVGRERRKRGSVERGLTCQASSSARSKAFIYRRTIWVLCIKGWLESYSIVGGTRPPTTCFSSLARTCAAAGFYCWHGMGYHWQGPLMTWHFFYVIASNKRGRDTEWAK
jgi:hypothetical protein